MSLTSYRAAPPRDRVSSFSRDTFAVAPSLAAGAGNCARCEDGRGPLSRSGDDLLSHVLRRSTIGAAALNCRVRDGVGCFPAAMITKPGKRSRGRMSAFGPVRGFPSQLHQPLRASGKVTAFDPRSPASTGSDQAYRTISTGQLNALPRLHLRPIDVVVYHGPQGYLVLRGASRLDAFSGYPFRS